MALTSFSCMACCIIWLEMVKGNCSMIGSCTSIPVKGRGLPMNIDCLPGQSRNSSGILFLRHTYLSNQCDGCTPMHAVLEQKQRNPSSQLPCSALTGRALQTRMSEHCRALEKMDSSISALVQHAWELDRHID